jgi:Fe-S cluster biogenesis protein NfuA
VSDVATKSSDKAKAGTSHDANGASSASGGDRLDRSASSGSASSVTPAARTDRPARTGEGAQVAKALSEFVVALVHADGGELYLVSASADDVHLHLTGTCAGCPGAAMTRERLLEPAVRGAAPKATVKVTTGWRVPDGASRIE